MYISVTSFICTGESFRNKYRDCTIRTKPHMHFIHSFINNVSVWDPTAYFKHFMWGSITLEGPEDDSVRIETCRPSTIIIIIIFLHGLGRLTCSGIVALPSFSGASTISSSSRFVVEGVIRQSGVAHSFKVVDPVLSVFESHVLYSRDLQFFCYHIIKFCGVWLTLQCILV